MIIIVRITDKVNMCTHYCGNPNKYDGVGADYSILYEGFSLKYEKDRDIACKDYEVYFKKMMDSKESTIFKKTVNLIVKDYKKAIKDNTYISLGCFCYPSKCHCDTILKYVKEKVK